MNTCSCHDRYTYIQTCLCPPACHHSSLHLLSKHTSPACVNVCRHRQQADSYDTLATKTTQYSARLLKKPDQCRAVAKASFLFATSAVHSENATFVDDQAVMNTSEDACCVGDEGSASQVAVRGVSLGREPKRVLECLQRSLKIADACKVQRLSACPHVCG